MSKRSVAQISDVQIKNRLKAWMNEALEHPEVWKTGKEWYSEAQDFVFNTAFEFGFKRYDVACIVAILSPNNKWERNKIDTITVLKAYKAGLGPDQVKVCTYNANKKKAFEFLEGNVDLSYKSPKTHSFAMNVGIQSPDHITVDKWHLRACVGRPNEGVYDAVESCTAAQYRRVEHLTAEVAHSFGLNGYEAQAIIWVMIKKIWNR
jgi:hypothetical protein